VRLERGRLGDGDCHRTGARRAPVVVTDSKTVLARGGEAVRGGECAKEEERWGEVLSAVRQWTKSLCASASKQYQSTPANERQPYNTTSTRQCSVAR